MEENTLPIEGIIFGLEGSIITSEDSWDRCLRLLLSEYGVEYNRAKLKPEMAGRTLSECATELKRRYPEHIREQEGKVAVRIKDFLIELFEKGLKLEEGFESFYAYASNNFKLAVATSLDEDVFTAVNEKLEFRDRFNAPLLFAAVTESKPSPVLFQRAAEKIGVEKEKCLAIEDSPNGVLAARHADMQVIGLTGTFDKKELEDLAGLPQEHIFEDYHKIREYLQRKGYSS